MQGNKQQHFNVLKKCFKQILTSRWSLRVDYALNFWFHLSVDMLLVDYNRADVFKKCAKKMIRTQNKTASKFAIPRGKKEWFGSGPKIWFLRVISHLFECNAFLMKYKLTEKGIKFIAMMIIIFASKCIS